MTEQLKKTEGILARWIAMLGVYEYNIQYRKGRNHTNADAVSRLPAQKCLSPDCFDCSKEQKTTNEELFPLTLDINAAQNKPLNQIYNDISRAKFEAPADSSFKRGPKNNYSKCSRL